MWKGDTTVAVKKFGDAAAFKVRIYESVLRLEAIIQGFGAWLSRQVHHPPGNNDVVWLVGIWISRGCDPMVRGPGLGAALYGEGASARVRGCIV